MAERGGIKIIKGRYRVLEEGACLAIFRIRIEVPPTYPRDLPVLFETGGRIPTIHDRHINSARGDACLYVPEEWKANHADQTFKTWLEVPVRHFLLGQLYYEQHGHFSHGERAHYAVGMIDAYAELLGVERSEKKMQYWLRILSAKPSKGHWDCPCGSRKIIRHCCRDQVQERRDNLDQKVAREMLGKLTKHMNEKKPKAKRKRISK